MACIPNCGRCNYTKAPYCCGDHCEQHDLGILGHCQPSKGPLDYCVTSSSSSTASVSGGDGRTNNNAFGPTSIAILVICLTAFACALVGAAFFLRRNRKIRKINQGGLSALEIKQFLEGSLSHQNYPKLTETTPLTSVQDNIGAQLKADDDTQNQQTILKNVEEIPYDKKYEIPEKGFKLHEGDIIGSGAYGLVYKALLSEIKVLIHLGKHDNIVRLEILEGWILGAFTSYLNSGVIYLFLEYCEAGNLLNYLRANKSTTMSQNGNVEGSSENYKAKETDEQDSALNVDDFIIWSIQIANALRFLTDKKVIHGDIAARNILLYTRDLAKLTDFGLSRRLYEYTNYIKQGQTPLPWRWISLEGLRDMQFSTQSDVWSFGVTIWEIFTLGDVPYTGLNWSQEFVYQVMDGLRLPKPRGCDDTTYTLMKSCWNNDPQLRPTFVELHKKLLDLRNLRNYSNI
ncbi:vascular endothelial growth factor receptor kdr-like isoform X2 [Folsomia candida]|uniref:vascular endothelial growth factor receptor kdr-like isoform X2 n=1 Tax=Folsomia candida TaxID=158441 RepID=UPI001604CD9C|nr:vascular endothelial growth factor receptor kdr-like isoform X2 [Folsomia candida]